jgi:NAD(P)-dependent dehydrogenase (short-subunit alcohol dehydrogenase family)
MGHSTQGDTMLGKQVLITGATSGIGEATALALAAKGASLTLLCRNREKGQQVIARIVAETGNRNVDLLIADLNDLASVSAAADEFIARGKPLHVLINNAGLINVRRELSGVARGFNDGRGIETMLYVNHLAHFVFTLKLAPLLAKSAPSRVVIVASDAHTFVKDLSWDDLTAEIHFASMGRYGQSKLANIWFMLELAKRMAPLNVSVNALHPGAVSTGLGTQNGWLGKLIPLLMKPFFKSPEQGARTSIYLASTDAGFANRGLYFVNCKPGKPKPWALDAGRAQRLWQLSESLTGVRWPL